MRIQGICLLVDTCLNFMFCLPCIPI